MEADKTYRPSLCYRCEERARFHEFGVGARCECHGPGSVHSCYMYRPVAPMVIAPNEGEKRDIAAPWCFSGRAHAVRIADGVTVIRRLAGNESVFWFQPTSPPAEKPKKSKPKRKRPSDGRRGKVLKVCHKRRVD